MAIKLRKRLIPIQTGTELLFRYVSAVTGRPYPGVPNAYPGVQWVSCQTWTRFSKPPAHTDFGVFFPNYGRRAFDPNIKPHEPVFVTISKPCFEMRGAQ